MRRHSLSRRIEIGCDQKTWCLDSPLICDAFGPQMAADLRKSADRRLRKISGEFVVVVPPLISSDGHLALLFLDSPRCWPLCSFLLLAAMQASFPLYPVINQGGSVWRQEAKGKKSQSKR